MLTLIYLGLPLQLHHPRDGRPEYIRIHQANPEV